jgi:pimeloyl-ACP methyl ester carboxylesterase|tara:strand:- start:17 stop:826 length:810 start_codon:yes stop_codon:yes gene_type:complete
MDFVEYGNPEGKIVVYLHGVPGNIEECALFDRHAKNHNLRILSFDRFSINNTLGREDYYQTLTNQIKQVAGTEQVDLIGFSIGAHLALEVSAVLKDQVRRIHLVSAAAPVNGGNFFDHMAGGTVFKLALQRPWLFALLTQYQRLMAVMAPSLLFSILFASAAGADRALCRRREFKQSMTGLLKHCFQRCTSGYVRDVNFYVTWSGDLSHYSSSVQLWHGAEDNWSPPAMATYLANCIAGAASVEELEGLSHYSCLYAAAPKICAQLAAD